MQEKYNSTIESKNLDQGLMREIEFNRKKFSNEFGENKIGKVELSMPLNLLINKIRDGKRSGKGSNSPSGAKLRK